MAGDITVSGIKTGDELNEVLRFIGAGTAVTDVTDLTSGDFRRQHDQQCWGHGRRGRQATRSLD
ncbi:MAG: hypothetical protein U1E25_14570 [Methylocystis sp.]